MCPVSPVSPVEYPLSLTVSSLPAGLLSAAVPVVDCCGGHRRPGWSATYLNRAQSPADRIVALQALMALQIIQAHITPCASHTTFVIDSAKGMALAAMVTAKSPPTARLATPMGAAASSMPRCSPAQATGAAQARTLRAGSTSSLVAELGSCGARRLVWQFKLVPALILTRACKPTIKQ